MDTAWIELDPETDREQAALDWLLQSGILSEEVVSQAGKLAESSARPLLITLNHMGALPDAQMALAFSKVTGLPLAPSDLRADDHTCAEFRPKFLKSCLALPIEDPKGLAVVNPLDDRVARAAEFVLGTIPKVYVAQSGDWSRAYQRAFPEQKDFSSDIDENDPLLAELADSDRDAPIVRQVATWISDAVEQGASDIHFEVHRSNLDVLFRIDGRLQSVFTGPKSMASSVVSRIKVIADLDLGERNRSQDGRASFVSRGRRIDIRVSIVPTINGECAVIRVLDRPNHLLSLSELGFPNNMSETLEQITSQKHGLFIVAGPTGSGKTTTLYACLESLKGQGLKILSVEDPVEYHFDHVNQVQVSDKAGRTFANALRAFLRHDPDVILVGEIRDAETAEVAVQAALSGHLVLATLHAIDTARVKTRLTDMGVDAFKIDACLTAAMAQRLLRKLCPHCRAKRALSAEEQKLFVRHGLKTPSHIYSPTGCIDCWGEGYRGRIAVAELSGHGVETHSLAASCLNLVSEGVTSLPEVVGLMP